MLVSESLETLFAVNINL